MNHDQYYAMLHERWERVDKESREAIHEYNEWKRQLRHLLIDEHAGSSIEARVDQRK